jgi:preprotein translocase subunit SecG
LFCIFSKKYACTKAQSCYTRVYSTYKLKAFYVESVLLVIHIVVCVSLVGVILLQPSSADGLSGSGGGQSSGGLMSARGTANFMTKLTAILATIFIVNSLILAYIATHKNTANSAVESVLPSADAPMPDKPLKPAVPLAK